MRGRRLKMDHPPPLQSLWCLKKQPPLLNKMGKFGWTFLNLNSHKNNPKKGLINSS